MVSPRLPLSGKQECEVQQTRLNCALVFPSSGESMALSLSWHVTRGIEFLEFLAGFFSAGVFRRAIIMPNLKPPVTDLSAALAYRDRIMKALPINVEFEPLMTLYLTDVTTRKDIKDASKCHTFPLL